MRKYRSIIFSILIIAFGILVFVLLLKKREQPSHEIVAEKIQVRTQKVELSSLPYTIEVTGTLLAKDKIELFSETQGVLEKRSKPFKIGTRFQRGDILLSVNSKEFEAQIRSNRSNLMNQIAAMLPDMQLDFPKASQKWEDYLEKFYIDQSTPKLPAFQSNEEKLFISGKNVYQTYYTIKNLEERLEKYTLIAPFDGIVTESNIDFGSLVRSGQKLGEFINDTVFEIHLAVPLAESEFLQVGSNVHLTSLGGSSSYSGNVLRINGTVDATTQTVLVIVELRSKQLKEGQYLKAQIQGKELKNVYEIDNSLIVEGNKVFVVQESILTLQPITIHHYQKEKVLISGLENGMLLVNEIVAGAYPGMQVERP